MNFHLNIVLAALYSFDICTLISIAFSISIISVSISDFLFLCIYFFTEAISERVQVLGV